MKKITFMIFCVIFMIAITCSSSAASSITDFMIREDINGDGKISSSESHLWERVDDTVNSLEDISVNIDKTKWYISETQEQVSQLCYAIIIGGSILSLLILLSFILNIVLLLKLKRKKETVKAADKHIVRLKKNANI